MITFRPANYSIISYSRSFSENYKNESQHNKQITANVMISFLVKRTNAN